VDAENPVITCPANITINTDAGTCSSTMAIGTAAATDNCTVAVTNNAPVSFPIENTTVLWTATDGSGNTDTCSQLVTVVDAENPIITCPGNITINTDAGLCTSTTSIGTAIATDNCTASPIITNDAPTNFPIGNTTVIWTASDVAGNIDTCSQLVIVVDAENPVITCPGNITINTDAGLCTSTATIGTATATDNCTVSPIIENDAPTNFPIGNTTVIWTATDGSGNTDTCSQLVTVVDAENPVVTCPGNITINTDAGVCTSTATIGTATATDNCTASPIITNDAPANFPIGNTTVIWTATDAAGNIDTCSQLVTVVDAENPIIFCPTDQIIIADNNCEIVIADYTSLASVTDNCDANPLVTQLPLAGSTLTGTGEKSITLTATDINGNISICTFLVTVSDTTAPVINCLENQVAALDANCEFLLPDYTEISIFSENCDKALITTQTPAVGTLYTNKEILPVELVFQDAAGNTSFCSFMVEIFLNPNNPNCGSELIITTLFTPNGDGKNDTWIIRGLKGKCTVMVFDRGGQKVFESSAYNNDWDGIANGNLLPEGDYYYIINCDDGINYKGPLTLLRTK
jgi:gliding motility-associated-like protein